MQPKFINAQPLSDAVAAAIAIAGAHCFDCADCCCLIIDGEGGCWGLVRVTTNAIITNHSTLSKPPL